ncbi:hypothetical protein DFQ50_104113 [Pseudocitrobacter faecalis]|uniref:Uncharacterized protein n=2 Tax=Pseudocitrobacter faecalis TaxID=1398493 RepID=A0ABX9FWU0_9ENTR|nr:hypothetical protein DFQ50_104113 [Pseudocitrobacter faecalis]
MTLFCKTSNSQGRHHHCFQFAHFGGHFFKVKIMKEKTAAERYAAAINAAMAIVNLREEIKGLLAIIHNNLTCSELLGGQYNGEAVKEAFKNAEVGIIPANYVKAECVLLKARVSLHEDPGNLGRTAMRYVIDESNAKHNLPK